MNQFIPKQKVKDLIESETINISGFKCVAIEDLEALSEYGLCYTITEKIQEDIETDLNMLKENSADIEQKNTEIAEKNAEIEKKDKQLQEKENRIRKLDLEAQRYFETSIKKDKIIDLMADYIATLDIEEDICANVKNDNCDKMNFGECEDCIKQYFERKVKRWKLK